MPPDRARGSPLRHGRLRALFDALPAEAYLVDPASLALVDCNAVAERRTGFTREELAGRPLSETDVQASPELMRALAGHVVSGELVEVEVRDATKDGRVRDVLVALQGLRLGRAAPLAVGIVTDVTEQRRWEQRLQESEERFRALFEAAPVAAIVVSLDDLRILDCNAAYAHLLGYPRCDLIGHPATLVTVDLDEAAMRALATSVPVGEILRIETKVRTRTGELREVLYVGRNLVIEGRTLAYGTLVDITESKADAEALRRAAAFEQRMVGIVSHDLRDPLSAIALQAAVTLRDPSLPPAARASLERIVSTAQRANRMIRDLLDFSRARHARGIPIRPEPADLAEVARGIVAEVREAFPDREVRLDVTGDVHGTWDGDRLAQVTANLVTNATKHGVADRPVHVAVRGDDDVVTLTVHNEGPPIPPEVLAHLFEPFRQAGEGGSADGVGLGLFIVRHLVDAHCGSVDVTSTAEGGTTFTVRLPRHAPGGTCPQPDATA